MGLKETELKEIENFTQAAPKLFTGLIMDETPQGRANANSVISHLYGQGLPLTMANLTASVVALQWTLFWAPGTEPTAQDTRSTRAPRDTNNGVPRYEGTQYTDRANGIESSWAKDIRLGKEAKAQKDAAKEKANQRFKETNQVVQNKVNGGIDYAASNALNEQARRRHAAEDAAQSGKPVRQTGPRSIPSSETDPNYQAWLRTASADEIKIYLSRKGRSHLMR
jgi:hypothetical protein